MHYDQSGSYLFVNDADIHKSKAKSFAMDNSKLISHELCLGNISTHFSADNMKKAQLYGNFYDFSID